MTKYAKVTSEEWTQITEGVNAYFEVFSPGGFVQLYFDDNPPAPDVPVYWTISADRGGFDYKLGKNCYARAQRFIDGREQTELVMWEE